MITRSTTANLMCACVSPVHVHSERIGVPVDSHKTVP